MHRTVASSPQLRTIGGIIAFCAALVIAAATLGPGKYAQDSASLCIICGSRGGVSAVLNVLLFIPLGAGLALAGAGRTRAVLAVFGLSVLIETAQLVAIPGRDASLGDLLTNSIGGILGFTIARHAHSWLHPSPRKAAKLAVGWGLMWLAVHTISSFALAPSFPAARYYGQLGRSFPNMATFRGQIFRASVDSIPIPDFAIADSRGIRELLGRGAVIETAVTPAEPAGGVAPIVRIADGERQQIVLLAQKGTDFVFGVRTGADLLRLRPPLFALRQAIPAQSVRTSTPANGVVVLRAGYGPSDVRIRVQTTDGITERRMPLKSSLGWTLVLPFQWYLNGSSAEVLLTWVWLAVLLFPLGYWSAKRSKSRDKLRPAIVLTGIFLLFSAGLGLTPLFFGLSMAPLTDWIAAAFGLAGGAILARALGSRDSTG